MNANIFAKPLWSIALGALLQAAGPFEPWDRFRGPNGSGLAAETTPLILPAAENLIWSAAVGAGASSPVVSGRAVYLTGLEGETLWTYAFDARGGALLWKRAAPRSRREKFDRRNTAASPTPAAGPFGVVVFFPDTGLLAYDPQGREKWRAPLGPFQNVYGMGASPIVAGGRAVLVADQGRGSYIAAFGLDDGRERWRTARPEALSGHSTPIVYAAETGAQLIVAPGSFRVDAYDLETGESRWHASGLPAEMKSTPVLFDTPQGRRLLVSGFNSPENEPGRQIAIPEFAEVRARADADGDGKLTKAEAPDERTRTYFQFLDLDGDGALDAGEWRVYRATMSAENGLLVLRPGLAGGGAEALDWSWRRGVAQCPSPLVYRGLVYMAGDSGVMTILDAATGKLVQQGRIRGRAEAYYASPVAAGGHVYLASHGGAITLLRAGAGLEPVFTRDLGEEILATPAFDGDRLYLRTAAALYCFQRRPSPGP